MTAQVAADVTAGAGVEGGERLVEEQQSRLGGQGAGQGDALGLAAGQGAGSVVGVVGEPDALRARWRRVVRASALAMPRARSPKATFSSADRLGNRR